MASRQVAPIERTPDGGLLDGSLATVGAQAPGCSTPPDGWLEQKISLGVINHGLYGAMSGDDDRLAVLGTAPNAAPVYGDRAVYLYRRVALGWQSEGLVLEPNTNERFGDSIAVDGSVIAIGAPAADSSRGAVYVFVTEGSTTHLAQRLGYPHVPSTPEPGFGASIALRGNVLIVGTSDDHVYVYERSGETWSLASEVVSADVATGSLFGWIRAFDGERLAVEFRRIDHVEEQAVVLFTQGSGSWVEEARIRPPMRLTPYAESISSSALEGDTVLVSTDQGRVFEYGRGAASWALQRELPTLGPDYRTNVHIRGSVAAVGGAERVAIFDKTAGGWTLREILHAGEEPRPRAYGGAVVLGPDSVAVFAEGDDEWGAGAGAIYGYVADPTARYEPRCIHESTTPGTGTECYRSGSASAQCRQLGPGAGTLHGSTPSGPIDLQNAWLDVAGGLGSGITMTFGAAAPRREDAVPRLSIRFGSPDPFPLSASAVLELCEGSLTVPATLTFTKKGDYYYWTPLEGTVTIDAPGWNVTGSFAFDGACKASYEGH